MATPTGTDPHSAPVPPGWPGDDPTVPEDLGMLGRRPRRARRGDDSGRGRRRSVIEEYLPRRRSSGHGDEDDGGPGEGHGGSGSGPTGDHGDGDDHRDGDGHGLPPVGVDDGDGDDRYDDDGGLDRVDDEPDDDDLVAGVQPAGRVLVVMVLALVLAMLVNADALVERAERKPPGRERDRSLAVWERVQDVSHVLQLHRIRQAAEWAVGDDDPDAAPVEPVTSGQPADTAPVDTAPAATVPGPAGADPAGTAPAAPDPTLRTPTAEEPLRLWVGGDSMTREFGQALVDRAGATGVVDATHHVEMASGLTRPDYFDWPEALADDVEEHDPEVVVAMFGVNDAQGIVLEDGTAVQEVGDARWAPEYRRRAGALMDQLREDGRLVVWVSQPPMRDPGYDARLAIVDRAAADEAASRPWVTVVDAGAALADPAGAYAETLPGPAGAPVDLRQGDGIHLTTAGGERLADHVLALIGARVDLSGAAGDEAGD